MQGLKHKGSAQLRVVHRPPDHPAMDARVWDPRGPGSLFLLWNRGAFRHVMHQQAEAEGTDCSPMAPTLTAAPRLAKSVR